MKTCENKADVTPFCEKYKNALLFHQTNKINQLETKIREILQEESDVFFHSTQEWAKKCWALGDKAIALAKTSQGRDCLAFDELEKDAKKLGSNVKGYICQKFDDVKNAKEIQFLIQKNMPPPKPPKPSFSDTNKKKIKNLKELLCKYATWDGYEGKKQVETIKKQLLALDPSLSSEIEQEIKKGKKICTFYAKAYKLGTQGKPEKELIKLQEEMKNQDLEPKNNNKLDQQYRKGKDARERNQSIMRFQKEQQSINTPSRHHAHINKLDPSLAIKTRKELFVNGNHPNSITQMHPSSKWTILVDETGSNFEEAAFYKKPSTQTNGRVVMLLVPEKTRLPNLPTKWHAVDQTDGIEIQKVNNIILDNECAVLGIPVIALNKINSEQWIYCIETLLDLVLRLLPIDGETCLDLIVEQRGEFTEKKNSLLEKTCLDALHRLSRMFPHRAEKIRKITSKFISKDQHPWNGYVDSVAFSWGAPNDFYRQETQWGGSCLLESSPHSLCACLDFLERSEVPSQELWNDLVISKDAYNINSLVSSLLHDVGEEATKNVEIWKTYLDFTLRHLDSKAINMINLAKQINWLKKYQPEEAELPLRLRLLWLTAKLAEENHRGCTNSFPKQREEFKALSDQLFLEDAPLVCFAALHLAVSYTNEFDFAGAKLTLLPWKEIIPAVPGLRYHAQLLSSFGQHEAFFNNNEVAICYFDRAIEAFKKLSDSHQASLEISQTATYLLTSLIDLYPASQERLSQELQIYFAKPLPQAIEELSCSSSDGQKYQYHLLLRYLLSPAAFQEDKNTYLAKKEEWACGDSHPWEMIEFYRGLLISEPNERLEHLQKAYEIARKGGITLQVIAAVILGTIWLENPSVEVEYQELVKECMTKLPNLANRGNILLEHLTKRYAPLELAKQVLPFNFR